MSIFLQTLMGCDLYHSSQMCIRQNAWYRWLVFQDQACIQTLIHRQCPHKPKMAYLLPLTWALRTQPGPTCLLGLGGGAVVHLASSILDTHTITAVDHSAEVIALSQRYFGLNTLPSLVIEQQDAYVYIANNTQKYAHILIDLYSDYGFPTTCAQPEFFVLCKNSLQENGFIALNIVNLHRELLVLKQLQTVFPATVCIPIATCANMIVLATESKSALLSLIQTFPKLKKFIWDPLLGYMVRFE